MVDAALAALAEGRSSEAIARLKDIDRPIGALPRSRSRILLSLRASILAISGQLSEFSALFRPAAPMRFNEINLFGLYVAPIAVILGLAWIIYLVLRRAGDRVGLSEQVWHPALFDLALYVIIVSSIVLVMARWGS